MSPLLVSDTGRCSYVEYLCEPATSWLVTITFIVLSSLVDRNSKVAIYLI